MTDALARKGIAYDDIAVYQTLYLFPYTPMCNPRIKVFLLILFFVHQEKNG